MDSAGISRIGSAPKKQARKQVDLYKFHWAFDNRNLRVIAMRVKLDIGKALRWLMGSAILGLGAWYGCSHWTELMVIRKIVWSAVAGLAVASILNTFVNAAQGAYVYRALGAHIQIWEAFHLSNVANAMGFIISQGTTIAKTAYLKIKFGIPVSQAPAIFLGLLVVFFVIGTMMMTGDLIRLLLQGAPVPAVYWLVLLGAVFSVIILRANLSLLVLECLPPRLKKMMELFVSGWKMIQADHKTLWAASLCQIGIFITAGVRIFIAYHGLEINLPLMTAISIAVFVAFSNLVALTPANLGIQETVIGYLTWLSGYPFAYGVAASALIRAVDILTTIVLAALGWFVLSREHTFSLSLKTMLASKTDAK